MVKRVTDTESFIEKGNYVHNFKYIYTLSKYIDSKTELLIICPKHGVFKQKPNDHLSGKGCKECYNERRGETQRSNNEEFIKKGIDRYGELDDYSKVKYINNKTKVTLICKKHGEYTKTPSEYLRGERCQECSKIETAIKRTMTFDDFKGKAIKKHNGRYEYPIEIYNGINDYVYPKCPIHGIFKQVASYHLSGNGCQQCAQEMKESASEREIYQFVVENYSGIVMRNYRKILSSNRELDIYLPSLKLAIEFDGLFWHSTKNGTPTNYHLNKTNECKDKGIRLIHIFEDELIYKKEIVKSNIIKLLNINKLNKINSSDCLTLKVSYNDAKTFLETNSIEESKEFDTSYGLYHDGELVSIMCFNGNEIVNFCDKVNVNVIGGFGKLLHYFISNNRPKSVICSIDRRWNDGSELEKLGFKRYGETEPSFTYVTNDRRVTKAISENKIYDCGRLLFILNENILKANETANKENCKEEKEANNETEESRSKEEKNREKQ